ncbi:MAG: hypothetical protein OEW49_00605 [Nitrosopumilus sp.]|nr:hypothetical protein [Nitrosopumilus sp.]
MNNSAAEKLVSQKTLLPNVNTLLKISLGLVLFTIISFILVYAETIPVDVDGTIYDVEYAATGMTVSAIEADLDFFSLILTVTVVGSPGVLDITLDRSFFDSTFNGLDDDFIILADGDEPIFTEIASNSQSRMLRIELPSGTEEVEIIGSSFSPVSVMIGDFDEDKAAADKAAADKAAADKAAADKAAADKAAADKAAADKAAADKAVPKVQCGPGTILKDGACVLDQRCGPGTILKDGACVLDSTSKPTQTSVKGMGKELVMGVVAAFVIAGTVGLILGIMSKASKSS